MYIISQLKEKDEEFHFPHHCALIALATVLEREEMRDVDIPTGITRIVNHAKYYDRKEVYVFSDECKLLGIAMFSVMNDPHYGEVVAHTVFNTLNNTNISVVRKLYEEGAAYALDNNVRWIARSKRLNSSSYVSYYRKVKGVIDPK